MQSSETKRFLYLLFCCISAIYITTAVVIFLIVIKTAWHPALLRFMHRVWINFVAYRVGSTSPGFINSIALTALCLGLLALSIWLMQGVEAMKKHIAETAALSVVALITAIGLVYGPQFVWVAVQTGYSEHEAVTHDNAKIHQELNDKNGPKDTALAAVHERVDRLQAQLTNACYLPDRRLTKEQIDMLHDSLRSIAIRYHQPHVLMITTEGDTESDRFSAVMYGVFQSAGFVMDTERHPQQRKAGDIQYGYSTTADISVFETMGPITAESTDRNAASAEILHALNGLGTNGFGSWEIPAVGFPVFQNSPLRKYGQITFSIAPKNPEWPRK